MVIIEATEEVAFLYASENNPEIKWVRPVKEFFDEKEVEGKSVKRFIFL